MARQHFLNIVIFGGDKRQPEIRLRSQAKQYHVVNTFASHAQLTFAALYDKHSTAK